jgi:hypothetical protein
MQEPFFGALDGPRPLIAKGEFVAVISLCKPK